MADKWVQHFTIKESHTSSQTIFGIFSADVTNRLCRQSAVWRRPLKSVRFLDYDIFLPVQLEQFTVPQQ